MSDRYIALTVLLEKPIKDEDAAAIIAAIEMVRGVARVTPVVADPMAEWAKETARSELGQQIIAILYPKG